MSHQLLDPASQPAPEPVGCRDVALQLQLGLTCLQGRFLPFLPSDNDDLGSPATQAALSLINQNLAWLLQQHAAEFWETVKADKSLIVCLDTYLRFRRC